MSSHRSSLERDASRATSDHVQPGWFLRSGDTLDTVTSQYAATTPKSNHPGIWVAETRGRTGPSPQHEELIDKFDGQKRMCRSQSMEWETPSRGASGISPDGIVKDLPRIHSRASVSGHVQDESPNDNPAPAKTVSLEPPHSSISPPPAHHMAKIAQTDAAISRLRSSLFECLSQQDVFGAPGLPERGLFQQTSQLAGKGGDRVEQPRGAKLSIGDGGILPADDSDPRERAPYPSPEPMTCVEHYTSDSPACRTSAAPEGREESSFQTPVKRGIFGEEEFRDESRAGEGEEEPQFLSPDTLWAKVNPPKIPQWPEEQEMPGNQAGWGPGGGQGAHLVQERLSTQDAHTWTLRHDLPTRISQFPLHKSSIPTHLLPFGVMLASARPVESGCAVMLRFDAHICWALL